MRQNDTRGAFTTAASEVEIEREREREREVEICEDTQKQTRAHLLDNNMGVPAAPVAAVVGWEVIESAFMCEDSDDDDVIWSLASSRWLVAASGL